MTDTPLDLSALVDSTPGLTPEARERLAARLQTLIESEHVDQIESRRTRRFGTWTHRAVVIAVAAAVVVVFFVPLPRVSLFTTLIAPAKVTTPTTAPTKGLPVVDLSATPAGWVPVAYGDVQVSVPATFWVYDQDACSNFQTPGTVYVDPLYEQDCASQPPVRSPQITGVFIRPVQDVPRSFTNGHSAILNGLRVYPLHLKGVLGYYAPAFGIEVTADGPLARSVVNTLTHSPRAVALSSRPAPRVPLSWRSVTFAGLSFSVPSPESPPESPHLSRPVPSDWTINQTQSTPGLGGVCRAPGVAFVSAIVTLATDAQPYPIYYCPFIRPAPEQPENGVQVDSGLRTEPMLTLSFSRHCLNLHSLTACPATSPAYSILVLKVTVPGRSKPVYVSIGLAGNGMLARTILYSLRAA
jgi:hypothetical protein